MSILAQYHGTCTECDETIAPGERIEFVDDAGWQHVICGQVPERAECVCERCFLVHNGECF